MTIRTYLVAGISAIALTACGGGASDPATEEAETPPVEAAAELHPLLAEVAAANYSLEKTHAFMTVKVGHNGGITQYRISFTDFDGDLDFDPANPEASSISFSINPAMVETNYPGDYAAGHPNKFPVRW